MKYKVSFFLWLVGIMLMLASIGTSLLGDRTSASGIIWIIGAAFVIASIFPTLRRKKK